MARTGLFSAGRHYLPVKPVPADSPLAHHASARLESARLESDPVPQPPAEPDDGAVVRAFQQLLAPMRAGWVNPEWTAARLSPEVAALLWREPGPDLIAALTALPAGACTIRHDGEGWAEDPAPGSAPGWPCPCQLVVAAAWQAVASWSAVRSEEALVAIAGAEPTVLPRQRNRPEIVDPARDEIALAIRQSPHSGALRLARARRGAAEPEFLSLAADGRVPVGAVHDILVRVSELAADDAADVLRWLVARVHRRHEEGRRPWTAAEFRAAARRRIVAAASHQDARRRNRDNRRVAVWEAEAGMATLAATLPEEVAHRIFNRLTAIARGMDDPADDRGLGARRADLLVSALLSGAGPECLSPAGTCGGHVEAHVVVSLETLLGGGEPGLLVGCGPIGSEAARELAADARWWGYLADSTTGVTETTRRRYRPSDSLVRLIRARDQRCSFPGCQTSAWRCDIDHTVPWPDGDTGPENNHPLCRRHHILKTHTGWRPDPVNPQRTWRTPGGQRISEDPDPPGNGRP